MRLFNKYSDDCSFVEKRTRDRHRRIVLTSTALALERGFVVLNTIISVPLIVNYLGSERYGLFVTITSLVGLLGFADFGIGNGLINAISEANGRDDRELARRQVTSAFIVLSGLAMVLGVLFATSYGFINWARIFNVNNSSIVEDTGPAVAIFVCCFIVNIPLGIAQRIRMGYQEGFTNSIWQIIGTILSLVAIIVVVATRKNLSWLILAVSGSSVIIGLMNSISLFGFSRPWLRPKRQFATRQASFAMLRIGFMFFLLQIGMAFALASDNYLVAKMLGNDAVARFSVTMRLFSIIPMVQNVLLGPLWPAFREAMVRNDREWTGRTLKMSFLITAILIIVAGPIMVIIGQQIIRIWTKGAVNSDFSLLVSVALATASLCIMNTLNIYLNAANRIRFQILLIMAMAVTGILAKLILAGIIGLAGIGIGAFIACIVCFILPSSLYIKSIVRVPPNAKQCGMT